MLAGFLLGIVHDRRLMREAQVNLAIRWFAGFGLNDRLPDHSSLTRIRQRWGAERFRRIFERTVQACVAAGIAKGEIVHVDASLIRADVAWESLAVRHVGAVAEANGDACEAVRACTGRFRPMDEIEPIKARRAPDPEDERALRDSKKTGKFKKVCLTDPDASMATSGRNRRLEPSYKQHSVVDDQLGVVLDVEVTTGEVNEGEQMLARLDAAATTTGAPIATVTADAGYAYGKIFGGLEDRNIAAVIPTKAEPIRSPVPLRRFRYDARHDIVKCPRGKVLRPGKPVKHGRFFHSRSRDCSRCDLKALCISKGRMTKSVVIGDHYPAWLACAPPARPMERGGRPPLPAPPVAIRGLSRRGEDLARPRPGGPARPAEHAHPGLPHSGGGEPQAARGGHPRRIALDARRHRRRDRSANRTTASVPRSPRRLIAGSFFNGPTLHR